MAVARTGIMRNRTARQSALLAGLCLAFFAAEPVLAASADALVRIANGLAVNFVDFPGTGSMTFQAASGEIAETGNYGYGSASAGNASITTFASASASAAGDGATVVSSAGFSDTFTITTLSSLPVVMQFAAEASGTVQTTHSGQVGPTAQAEAQWMLTLNGPGTNIETGGRRVEQWARRAPDFIPQREVYDFGLGFDDIVIALSVPGDIGATFSIGMSSSSSAKVASTGTFTAAVADFGSTLAWRGLISATFEDGTPYTGPIFVESESGFDYARPVPLPTAALLLLGPLGLIRFAAVAKSRT